MRARSEIHLNRKLPVIGPVSTRDVESEAVNFCGSRSALMKEVGSRSESVEKELEAEAIFSKLGASRFSNGLQPLG